MTLHLVCWGSVLGLGSVYGKIRNDSMIEMQSEGFLPQTLLSAVLYNVLE